LPELELVYAEAAQRLPSLLDDDVALGADQPPPAPAVFERGTLPTPPEGVYAERLLIVGGSHGYGALTVDLVEFCAHRETYRALGLFVLAALLRPGPNRFELALTHPASQVRRLVVDTTYRRLDAASGLRTEASGAVYFPARRRRLALADAKGGAEQLPHVMLTDAEEVVSRDWPGDPIRDTVVGFGSESGAYVFAELLLDVGQEWNTEVEYMLEGPYGFGGVAPASAEVRLWLPGSLGWYTEDWSPASDSAAG